MSWTAPMTFVAATTLTAAQLNIHLRDNLNETAPAKATTAGRIFVSTGANAIAERAVVDNLVSTSETTISTTYVDLTTVGPVQTVTTGTRALVIWHCGTQNSGTGNTNFISVAVSSATTIAASDTWAIQNKAAINADYIGVSGAHLFTTLTAGSNVFTLKYRVTAGTGTFSVRDIIVIGL